jgi:hypothetical protein
VHLSPADLRLIVAGFRSIQIENCAGRTEGEIAMNVWEAVFSQSRVNNGYYDEQWLPQSRWDWPSKTWFQGRLDYVREHEPIWALKTVRKSNDANDVRAL